MRRAWLIAVAACSSAPQPAAPPAADTRAIAYLEMRAQDWIDHTPQVGQNIQCAMSCHTTHMFLVVRPMLGSEVGETFKRIRTILDRRVEEAGDLRNAKSYYGAAGSEKEQESRSTEGVMNAATLAIADRGYPRTITRAAFGRMWEMQRADGGFDWLDFDLEPWESEGDWGASLAALAVDAMPDDAHEPYRDNIERLRRFLLKRARDVEHPMWLHDRIMMLRTSVLPDRDRRRVIAEIQTSRREDGGWSLADWGRGKRRDEPRASDAYATAFATLALCEAGDRDERGLAWLASHRRDDGTWSGRSVNSDAELNQLFMSDAATAYAALAFASCR